MSKAIAYNLSLTIFASLVAMQIVAADEPRFELQNEQGKHLDVKHAGDLVGRYMYDLDLADDETRHETYKPYLHVFNPSGTQPITKGAGGKYTHHRGIFRGWAKLTLNGKRFDTWHMKNVVQEHLRFEDLQSNADAASFTSVIRFRTDDGKTLFEEDRTMSFQAPPEEAYAVIDVTSKVKATEGTIILDGDPEHAGLQFRPADEIETSKTQYCFPRDNANPKKDRDYAWVVESFVVDGNRYNVLYLNHPENEKNAVFSAYRNYGRFGAWFKTEIPEEESKTTRVRFVVTEGEMPAPEYIQQQYNNYTGKSDPVPSVTVKNAG